MTTEKTDQKRMTLFCLLCSLVYFTSYLTRKSYNASILAIVEATGVGKQLVGMAVMGSFITYGVGQVISGFLGDKIRPRIMITVGLTGAALCNLLIPFVPNVTWMCVVWCINGFFQSMMWPPLVRAMSENFSVSYYNRGSRVVLIFSSIATIAVYALVSLCVKIGNYRTTFFCTFAFGLAVAALWYFADGRFEKHPVAVRDDAPAKPEERAERKMPLGKILLLSGALPIMLTTALCGLLRDGIETWMSSFINESYGIDTSGAILSVSILPILSILSYYYASWMQKLTKSVLAASAAIWGLALVMSLLLSGFYRSSVVIGIAGVAILSGTSHAINLLMTSCTMIYYRKTGYVSTISGLLNACTYVGSAVATYGIAGIAENRSWTFILLLFAGVTGIGLLASLLVLPRWNRFAKKG